MGGVGSRVHQHDGAVATPSRLERACAARRDWRNRMSNNVAAALLVYTGLQIFMTLGALRGESPSLLPYMALLVLVAAIIPACRRLEARWNRIGEAGAFDPGLATAFRRDRLALWLMAIGLPFALTGLFRLLGMVFGR